MAHGGKRANAGRKEGSTNKDTEFKKAIKEGIPVSELLRDIKSLDTPLRVDRLLRLLEFAYPKMKSVEVKGEMPPLRIIIEETDEADEETDEGDTGT